METTNELIQPNKVGVKYGIMGGVISIAYSTLLNITDNQANQALGWLNTVFFIAVLFFALREFKNLNKGFMTFKEGLTIGGIASAISGAMSAVYIFVYTKFIDTTFFETIQNIQREEFEKKGMSEEQIEQAMTMMSKMMSPELTAIFGLFGAILIGLIVSAIMAAIMKKEPTMF